MFLAEGADGVSVVESLCTFSTVCAETACKAQGRHYYEVSLVTNGLMQIGWADSRQVGSRRFVTAQLR